jgi:hypothetical protein
VQNTAQQHVADATKSTNDWANAANNEIGANTTALHTPRFGQVDQVDNIYNGPHHNANEFSGAETAMGAVDEANKYIHNASSGQMGDRDQALNDTYSKSGRYTAGERGLDNSILGGTSGGQSGLANIQAKFGNFGNTYTDAAKQVQGRLDGDAQKVAGAKTATDSMNKTANDISDNISKSISSTPINLAGAPTGAGYDFSNMYKGMNFGPASGVNLAGVAGKSQATLPTQTNTQSINMHPNEGTKGPYYNDVSKAADKASSYIQHKVIGTQRPDMGPSGGNDQSGFSSSPGASNTKQQDNSGQVGHSDVNYDYERPADPNRQISSINLPGLSSLTRRRK